MVDIYIIGAGGFAREVFWYIKEMDYKFRVIGFVDNKTTIPVDMETVGNYHGVPIYNEYLFDYSDKCVVIATGYPGLREKIFEHISVNFKFTDFPNIISPTAHIVSPQTLRKTQGIIIASGCAITSDVTLLGFVNLNMNTTVGHDTIMRPFATTATNVSISGNVKIGKRSYLGNNSSIKEHCVLCNDVIIGMGGVVVKSIGEAGTYVGNPVKRLVHQVTKE